MNRKTLEALAWSSCEGGYKAKGLRKLRAATPVRERGWHPLTNGQIGFYEHFGGCYRLVDVVDCWDETWKEPHCA